MQTPTFAEPEAAASEEAAAVEEAATEEAAVELEEPPQAVRTPAAATTAELAPTAFRKLRRLMECLEAMIKYSSSSIYFAPISGPESDLICRCLKPTKRICYSVLHCGKFNDTILLPSLSTTNGQIATVFTNKVPSLACGTGCRFFVLSSYGGQFRFACGSFLVFFASSRFTFRTKGGILN